MQWMIPGTGLEMEPFSVWEVLEYRHTKFHALVNMGPMVHIRLEATDETIWAFASDLIIQPEDVEDPETDDWEDESYKDGWYDYDNGLHWSDFVELDRD